MNKERILYISPMNMTTENGMMQRQHQWLKALCAAYPGRVDFLSLGDTPTRARKWLLINRLEVRVLDGPFAKVARINAMIWYFLGIILCNKLRWLNNFTFPICTPLPSSWLKYYPKIICYYAWSYMLLDLQRAGKSVTVDLGDIMADRHKRTGACRWISLSHETEYSLLSGQARCIAISDNDASEFKSLYAKNLPVIPFVPPNSCELIDIDMPKDKRSIGFIGAPSYLNEKILNLLSCDEFLYALKEAGITLTVAGGICETVKPEIIKQLLKGGAKVIGRIKDSETFYKNSGVILNPVGPSTGIKIKSVEALMAGRKLITTRWGSDSSLEKAFPGQIFIIDWPVTATSLFEACTASINMVNIKNKNKNNSYTYRGIGQEIMSRYINL